MDYWMVGLVDYHKDNDAPFNKSINSEIHQTFFAKIFLSQSALPVSGFCSSFAQFGYKFPCRRCSTADATAAGYRRAATA
jgi:hypothetical protein